MKPWLWKDVALIRRFLETVVRFAAPMVLAVSIVYGWLMLLPWNPPLPWPDLEGSWQMMLPYTVLKGWQFGKDIVFTYGPLGWLAIHDMSIHPDLLRLALAIQAFLVFMTFLGVHLIAWRVLPRPSGRAVWGAVLSLLLVECGLHFREVIIVVLIWAYLLLWFTREDPLGAKGGPGSREGGSPGWIRVGWALLDLGLASALAIISLYKFSFAMMALIAVAGVTLDAVIRRRIPWQGLAFLVFCGLGWLATGQSFSAIWPYIQSSLELTAGYGMTMQWKSEPLLTLAAYATTAALIGGTLWGMQILPRWRLLLATATMAAVLFLVLKASLVRACFQHTPLVVFSLPVLALLSSCALRPWAETARRSTPLRGSLIMALGLAVGVEVCYADAGLRGTFSPPERWAQVVAAANVLTGKSDYPSGYLACPKGAVVGWRGVSEKTTVDLYPFDTGLILASGGDYRPRPMFQSYAAYTPALAALNAEHLRSERAAELVYFRVQCADEHYPSLADGLSWPELLTRYDLHSDFDPTDFGGYLPLQRSATPRRWKLELLEERQIALDEPVLVPATAKGPVWVEIFAEPRRYAAALSVLLREPVLRLEVETATGNRDFRIPRGMAASGFLLAPIIEDTAWFAWVASARWEEPFWQRWLAAENVRRMTVHSAEPKKFRAPLRVKFYRLDFDGWNNRRLALTPEQLALFELARTPENRPIGSLQLTLGQKPAFAACPNAAALWRVSESNVYAPLPPFAGKIRVQYGLIPSTPGGKAGPPMPGFSFAILTVDERGNWKQIWSDSLELTETEPLPICQAEVPVQLKGVKAVALIARKPEGDGTRLPAWLGLIAE